jgi:uncharacterized protein (DUF2141 family)
MNDGNLVAGLCLMMMAAFTLADEDLSAINVVVTGAEPQLGNVMVTLFNSAENYMQEPLAEAAAPVDGNGNARVALGAYAPGDYAVVVFYDKNSNGKLDTGLFRIPKEKIGYSNNARGRFGPAKWTDTRFLLGDNSVQIEVQLGDAKRDN